MASTNKTPHLGLNQWVLPDPFLMEDMNADNQKLDTAITALGSKAEFVPLKTVTATVNNLLQVDVQVTDIDFTQWQFVLLDITIPQSCELRINGTTQGNYLYLGNSSWTSNGLSRVESGARVIFLTHGGNAPKIRSISLTDYLIYGNAGVSFKNLSTLNFVTNSSNPFAGACAFQLWGVK